MPLKKLRLTPQVARRYLLSGIFLLALPSMLALYDGHEGKLLVATGVNTGEPFDKSVIYLAQHSVFGAAGVIINKPLLPDDIRPDVPIEKEEVIRLMLGGPVDQNKRFFYLDENKRLKKYDPYDKNFGPMPERLYAGYAGWYAWQLNREITRYGAWGVVDYDENIVREREGAMWDRAMKEVLKRNPPVENGV